VWLDRGGAPHPLRTHPQPPRVVARRCPLLPRRAPCAELP
jgi:hypothetical protein